jgi:ATP-dependent protease Clp ATPase subunit
LADRYITHNVLLETADFNILVIEFPEEDVNDKLAILASEKGLIYKHLYEDFVLSSCMANSGPFFFHIRKRPELLMRFAEIRKEALSLVFRLSPGFNPDNIFINENNVLKTESSLKTTEKSRPLIDNDLWDQDPPLSNFGPGVIISAPALDRDDDRDDRLEDEGDPEDTNFTGPEPPSDNPFADSTGGGGMGSDVPYDLVGHKWDTPGVHINVRQYEESEDALIQLLGGTPFESVRGYHLLIVELCIEDFSDVFHLLDKMGVSKKNKPEVMVKELYDIAILYNPFLKLEDINLKQIKQEYRRRNQTNHRTNNRRLAAAGNQTGAVRKRGIKFADLTNEKLLAINEDMKKRIVGQDVAIEHIADAVQRASVGLKRDHEPIGVLLFTGKTGVGKTETAKVLADTLGAHLVRIDCQEYQQPHEVAKLTGSPPGYVGYDDGGHLTKEVAKYPFSVVLFDEVEKGHNNFHERLLQIIDDGILTESKGGRKVSFSETLILMTSNIGVKEVDDLGKTLGFGDVSEKSGNKASKARGEALKKKFKPEFLNRVDEIVHFRDLEKDDYLHVLDIILDETAEQIEKSKSIAIKVSDGAKNFLLDNGIDQKFGARPLRRAVKRHLSTPLARAILKEEVPGQDTRILVNLNPSRDALVFRTNGVKKDAVRDDSE